MKGLERISSVRLAEILSQSDLIPTDMITEALYEQDSSGIPFVEVLVDSEQVDEWEIAKVVVQHFQLPFVDTETVDISRDAVGCLTEDFLFQHRLLPVDLFGNVMTIAMPIMTPYKVLAEAQDMSKKDVFPLVGLQSTNLAILKHLFPNRPEEVRRPKRKRAAADRSGSGSRDSSWMNIFDMGDQEVLKDLNG